MKCLCQCVDNNWVLSEIHLVLLCMYFNENNFIFIVIRKVVNVTEYRKVQDTK